MSEWQPIETAPIEPFNKEQWFSPHSPRLLCWDGHNTSIGHYYYTEKGKGKWRDFRGVFHPTHWMPIPEPPK